jgi:hypothetical protein
MEVGCHVPHCCIVKPLMGAADHNLTTSNRKSYERLDCDQWFFQRHPFNEAWRVESPLRGSPGELIAELNAP